MSNLIIGDTDTSAEIVFSHFIGATAVFKMKSKNYIRIYSMYHHQPMVSSKDVITNGNYDGTFAPNSLIYLTFTSYSVFNDNNYLSVVGNKDDTPISNLVTIKLPTNMLKCLSQTFRIKEVSDQQNGCILVTGTAPSIGNVYYLINNDAFDTPDFYILEKYGNFLGYFDHNEFSTPICNLGQNQVYLLNLLQVHNGCYSSILRQNITTGEYNDETKWSERSITFQHLSLPGTKQTGVNYRHYGGVERESVAINSELVDENGVLKVSLPKEVYQSNIDDNDLANYNVKWRKAKLKENNLSLKFVLIGSGDVYIALSSTDEKPNPQDIIKDGYSIGFMSDELVRVKLSDIDGQPTVAHVVVQVAKDKVAGPFSTKIKQ